MSIADLAAATGISWRQTQAALKKLDELGIIFRTGGRGRITCVQLPGSGDTSRVSALVRPESSRAELGAEAYTPSEQNADAQADGKTTQAPVLVQRAIREHLSRLLYHLKTPDQNETCVPLPGSGTQARRQGRWSSREWHQPAVPPRIQSHRSTNPRRRHPKPSRSRASPNSRPKLIGP